MTPRGVMMRTRILGFMVVFAIVVATSACGSDGGLIGPTDGFGDGNGDDDPICSVNPDLLFSILSPDGIPALTEPPMVAPDDPDAGYLFDFDRVLGVVIDGEARAYPHNILWHHEIVNDRIGDTWFSVTFCPLTGSGLVFDPFVDGTRLDLGVSGLLFANNLVLFDRITGDLYGPQLSVEGKCGAFQDRSIGLRTVQEMSWGRWRQLHPFTKVVSENTGITRNYRAYPYGSYDEIDNGDLLFAMNVDRSRPIKERVLAIRTGEEGGRGYPFGALRDMGATSVVNEVVDGVPTVVFYEELDGETAIAYDARFDGQTLTFGLGPNGKWVDNETGSTWRIDGKAIAGELNGERLKVRENAYVLFWFAWRHFQPAGVTFRQ